MGYVCTDWFKKDGSRPYQREDGFWMDDLLLDRKKIVPFTGSDLSSIRNGQMVVQLPEYATLPAASSMVGRMVRNTTNGRVYESRKVFNNAGMDTVNLGRPTNLIDLLNNGLYFLFSFIKRNHIF
jgi:hypothetical protein